MKHVWLSRVAAFTVLTVLAYDAANAQHHGQRSGISNSHSIATDNKMPQKPKRLRHGRRQPSANVGGNAHALSVYIQWKKCLDNMLPKCP